MARCGYQFEKDDGLQADQVVSVRGGKNVLLISVWQMITHLLLAIGKYPWFAVDDLEA